MTQAQLDQLETELTTDPRVYGYAAPLAAGNDAALADLLNQVRAGITLKRTDVGATELVQAINVADYTSIGATPTAAQLSTERRYLAWLATLAALGEGRVRLQNDDGTDTPVTTNLKVMFASGTGTFTRIAALLTRTASRAEELFGRGVRVTSTDIAQALRG